MNFVLFNYPTTVYFPESQYTEEELVERIAFIDRMFRAEIRRHPNVPDILELYGLVQEWGQYMLHRLREGIAAEAARDAEEEEDEDEDIPVIEISDDEEPVVHIKQEYEPYVPSVLQPLVPLVPVRIEDEEEDQYSHTLVPYVPIRIEEEEEQYSHTVYREEDIDIDNYSPYSDEDMSDEEPRESSLADLVYL